MNYWEHATTEDLMFDNIDQDIATLFMRNADDPIKTHVMGLVHDWWATAPQSAIDQYHQELLSIPGAPEFLAERHMPETVQLDDLEDCAPGTLGHAYKHFIVDNDLMANLATNYHAFFAGLEAEGRLERMPDDIKYMFVRGFMLHDFAHVITGHAPDIPGELGMAGFHFAQMHSIYHAMRTAVTTTHVAFVQPRAMVSAMDALATGWLMGRRWKNIHFTRWEEELDRSLDDIRAEYGATELVTA